MIYLIMITMFQDGKYYAGFTITIFCELIDLVYAKAGDY